jgi:hypothetical protein
VGGAARAREAQALRRTRPRVTHPASQSQPIHSLTSAPPARGTPWRGAAPWGSP